MNLMLLNVCMWRIKLLIAYTATNSQVRCLKHCFQSQLTTTWLWFNWTSYTCRLDRYNISVSVYNIQFISNSIDVDDLVLIGTGFQSSPGSITHM